MKSYLNCTRSPGLSIIENYWQTPKQYTMKYPHWTDAVTKELIVEGLGGVTQKSINNHVESMPKRLQRRHRYRRSDDKLLES